MVDKLLFSFEICDFGNLFKFRNLVTDLLNVA